MIRIAKAYSMGAHVSRLNGATTYSMKKIEQQSPIPEKKTRFEQQAELQGRFQNAQPTLNKIAGRLFYCDPRLDYQCAVSACEIAEAYNRIEHDIEVFKIPTGQVIEKHSENVKKLCDSRFCHRDLRAGFESFLGSIRDENTDYDT
jgi:hypothetical protein